MIFGKKKKIIADLNKTLKDSEERISRLEKEMLRLQAILGSMVEGVIAVDKDTKILSVNPTIEKLFNVSKKESIDRLFLEAIPNSDIAEVISKVFKEKEQISEELSIVWPVQKVFQVNASPIFEGGSLSGCLLVIHDITQMRKLETMRRDFVANVSHELRTPLTSIKGFVETLLEGALDDKENSRNFLKIIEQHSERLNSLINDLLDLSYLESESAKLNVAEFDLRQLSENVLLAFRAQLKKKSVSIENSLSEGLKIKADKEKIEQVFTNLIENALKFNKEGGFIKIYSEVSGQRLKVTIEDSGIGIPEKDTPRIFERFYRVDKARSRELGGTGLGLSIVKHIVELHGGTVGVESTEGLGSKFHFSLPI